MRLIELMSTDPPGRVPLHPRLTVVGNVGSLSALAEGLAAELGHPALGPEDMPRPAPEGAVAEPPPVAARREAADRPEVTDPAPPAVIEAAAEAEPPMVDAEPPAVDAEPAAAEAEPRAEDAEPAVVDAEAPAADAEPPAVADPGPDVSDPIGVELEQLAGRLAVLAARRAEVAAQVAPLPPDAGRVRAALDVLHAAEVEADRSRERRLSLANAWSDVVTRLAACPAALAPSAEVLAQAREAVATARAELQWADRVAGVTPTADLADLDRAHVLVEAAEARAARPLSGGSARRELAEARERERLILEGLGFMSYMDRHLTEALSRPDPTAVDRCDQARAAVADAEAVLAELEVMSEEAIRRERLESEAASYMTAAERLLGGRVPGDVALALRAAPDPGLEAAAAHLRITLGEVDHGSAPAVGDDIVAAAQHFLAAAAEAAAVQAGLRHQLEAVDRERSDIERERADLEDQRAAVERDRAAAAERDRAVRAAAIERDRAARAAAIERDSKAQPEEPALPATPPAPPPVKPAAPAVQAAAPAVQAAPPAVKPAPAAPVAAAPDPEPVVPSEFDETKELEFFLLAHLAGHRGTDEQSSVPLVLRDAFVNCSDDAAFAGLLLLERLADSVQVLYLTDEPRLHRWVTGLGEHRAGSHQLGWEPVLPTTALTVGEAVESALQGSQTVLDLEPPRRRTQCQVCRSGIATAVCDHCALHLCDEHLIRTAGRRPSAERVLCLQCGLVAAGVRRRR